MKDIVDIEVLVKMAKEGNENCKGEILTRFKGYIVNRAKSIYIKNYDMEDLLQIGYISIIKAIEKYDLNKCNFVSYVTLAINNNLNYEIRKNSKNRFDSSLNNEKYGETEEIDLIQGEENIEENIMKKEERDFVQKAIMCLNEEEKELVYSIYFENMKIKKYGEIKKIKYSTLIKRKNKILNKLKEKMKENRELSHKMC